MTLSKYFQNRRKEKDAAAYRDGFGWAFTAYHLEGMEIDDISARVYGSADPFDKGARFALSLLASKHRQGANNGNH